MKVIAFFGLFPCESALSYRFVLIVQLQICYISLLIFCFQVLLILLWLGAADAKARHHRHHQIPLQGLESGVDGVSTHSCIHDQIIEQRKRPGRKVYSVTPQVYHEPRSDAKAIPRNGRVLLSVSEEEKDVKQPIRIYLNYDAVGHSLDRDCQRVGDIVKVGILGSFQ